MTTENMWLHKDGENVVVKADGAEKNRVPIHLLGGIVCFGSTGISPSLMGYCAERGVCISFLNRNGRFLARVEGPVSGNVLLRRVQYRIADDEKGTSELASSVIVGKLFNQRVVVRRALRDHRGDMSDGASLQLEMCEQRLTDAMRRANQPLPVDELRGIEGEAAQAYYEIFNNLILNDHSAFEFTCRSRRPPLDPVNALLSFFYTLLTHDCRSALETVGLDSAVGFLHRDRPGRPSLALDLMEELRPILADRLALSLINRRQVSADDFEKAVSGAVTLKDNARKIVLVAYQDRKKNELVHPFLKEKTTFGLIPFIQSSLLARFLRDDLDGYPPFLWR